MTHFTFLHTICEAATNAELAAYTDPGTAYIGTS